MADPTSRPRVVLVNRCLVLGEDGKLLIIQRAATDSRGAGQWEVPGGKLDISQDLSHALEREVMEETGLLVEPISRLVTADSYVLGTGPYAGMTYVVLFGIARVVGGRLALSHEHDAAKWMDFDEALEHELTDEVRKALIILQPQLKRLEKIKQI